MHSEQTSWSLYKRLLRYVRPYWHGFAISFLGFGLYGASQAASAKWLEMVVNAVEAGEFDQRYLLAIMVLAIFASRGLGTFIGSYSIAYIARQVIHGLRVDLFETLQRLPTSFYNQSSSGQILAKLTYNVEQVTEAVTEAIKVGLREGMTVIGLFGYMLYLNWKLTLIFIGAAPFIGIVVLIASRKMRTQSKQLQESVGDITDAASEAVRGYQIVRIFGGAEFESDRFFKASDLNRRQFMKLVVTQSLNTPIIQLLVAAALAVLMFIAMHPSVMQGMTTGSFVAFLTAAGLITKPLRLLTDVNTKIQRGIAASEGVFAVMDEPVEVDTGAIELGRAVGDLKFSDLSFAYPGTQDDALKQINLDIPAGTTVALVGKSGSGKSTLVSLLPRFNDGWRGELLLDGQALESCTLESLREQIALVNQQVVLFNGTIADNIAYGALASSTPEQIKVAAEAAHVMEFVERLPKGLETEIGEGGVLLSGGQRQRIAIARAILKNAPILILDEATSALDTESERHIQEALDEVVKGRTTLIIAHRLSTIEKADLIVVMDQGQIVERGTHAELLALDGAYAQLHRMQFSEQRNG
ncbi:MULTISPECIES: lipid A export permease/ATP-binding protein MsbA [unclassified Marinobacterium]|uniref:lipid A export permease/ATP-binding protein MsbA n=1 Tax=unclassified Marinobacterium TaxID=2644139 RepID=UPI0015693234|nr:MULTISPECIES: lipid A export permease/ATP-binding protein MsbA [unclassified Marinobacterium]NRP27837.1 Lipid A export ATP-binding/permease protein MsbA [Marinobacterium sp. xm-d-420]NRP56903.1 Lipid A export ATP-binding/permease protein MsbA [Marinobacterium sp. xm-d-510]NRP96308.1 Lipid A export ATP-binding/permease protein MsbA [Marinobacterium sp. xm-a-127]